MNKSLGQRYLCTVMMSYLTNYVKWMSIQSKILHSSLFEEKFRIYKLQNTDLYLISCTH